eukprot:175006_1
MTIHLAALVWVLMIEFILVPIMIYSTYKYWTLRKRTFVYHRSYRLVLTLSILLIILVATERAFDVLFFTSSPTNRDDVIKNMISASLWALIVYPIAYLLCLRMWIVSYNIHMSQSLEKLKWKNIINPTQTTWYLTNLDTYGNTKWLLLRISIPCSVIIVSYLLVFNWQHVSGLRHKQTNSFILYIIEIIIIYIPTIPFLVYIRCKTPEYHDIFEIRAETSLIIKICVIELIISISLVIISTLINKNTIDEWYFGFIDDICIGITAFLLVMAQTYWPIKRLQKYNNTIENNLSYCVNSVSKSTEIKRRNLFVETFKNAQQFEAFMLHVQKEFSIENIVGYIELYQLGQMILCSKQELEKEYNQFIETYGIFLANDIPSSAILSNKQFSINKKIILLYKKYIETMCELELNLPFSLRNNWKILVNELRNELSSHEYKRSYHKDRLSIFSLSDLISNNKKELPEIIANNSVHSNSGLSSNDDVSKNKLTNEFVLYLIELIHKTLDECVTLIGDTFTRFDEKKLQHSRKSVVVTDVVLQIQEN